MCAIGFRKYEDRRISQEEIWLSRTAFALSFPASRLATTKGIKVVEK
jgi:hypothetical protein